MARLGRLARIGFAAILGRGMCWPQDAGTIKTQFAEMLGEGRYAQVVYEASRDNWGNTAIRAVDSRDGIVRDIRIPEVFGAEPKMHGPHLTKDGRRIVLCDARDYSIWVMNWDADPSSVRRICGGYPYNTTWRDSAGGDWVLVARPDGKAGIWRVNIDNPAERAVLYSKDDIGQFHEGFNSSHQSLSFDGTRLVANLPHPAVGILTVPDEAPTFMPERACNCYISPNNNYHVSMTSQANMKGVDGHALGVGRRHAMVWNQSGTCILSKDLAPIIGDAGSYDDWSWSGNDEDIFTFKANGAVYAVSVSTMNYVKLPGRGFMDLLVIDTSEVTGREPVISPVADLQRQSGETVTLTVYVHAVPRAGLTVTGLPEGIALRDGAAAASFVIEGASTDTAVHTIIVAATNSQGTARDTFLLSIGSGLGNDAPVVDAGQDRTVAANRTGLILAGTVVDDGIPNATPVVAWAQVAGPSQSVIADATNPKSSVLFPLPGLYRLELMAFDGALTTRDTVAYTAQEAVALRVTAPAAGDVLVLGSTTTVAWEVFPGNCMVIEVSTDGGRDWRQATTASCVGDAATFSWQWIVDPTLGPSEDCLVRVQVYTDQSVSATSGLFTLVEPSMTVGPSQHTRRALPRGLEGASTACYGLDGRQIPSRSERSGIGSQRRPLGAPNGVVVSRSREGAKSATTPRRVVVLP